MDRQNGRLGHEIGKIAHDVDQLILSQWRRRRTTRFLYDGFVRLGELRQGEDILAV